MKNQLEKFWQLRSRSERVLLLAWVIIVASTLIYFGLISPLYSRIARLEKNIPALETQLFAMRSQPAPGNTRNLANSTAPVDLRSTVFRFLASQQLTADVRSVSADRIELRLPEMPAENALALLEKLRQETTARIATMSMKNSATGGPVQVVVEVERRQ